MLSHCLVLVSGCRAQAEAIVASMHWLWRGLRASSGIEAPGGNVLEQAVERGFGVDAAQNPVQATERAHQEDEFRRGIEVAPVAQRVAQFAADVFQQAVIRKYVHGPCLQMIEHDAGFALVNVGINGLVRMPLARGYDTE